MYTFFTLLLLDSLSHNFMNDTHYGKCIFHCNLKGKFLIMLEISIYLYTITINLLTIEITPPNIIRIQPKANSIECSLEHTPNMEC